MELLLRRRPSKAGCTISELFINGAKERECYVLEDVVRANKVPGETAIPAGRYHIIFTFSVRFGCILPELLSVPGFVGIRIHSGNTAKDTEGCLIPGKKVSADGTAVTFSRIACALLFAEMLKAYNAHEDIWITVKDAP